MRMYIANGTHQNIDFQYRLPEYKNYRQQNIPIGGQIQISGDLSTKAIELIAEHHAIYGMIHYKELSNYKDILVPYVYSVDQPISADVIAELIVQNREYNKQLGIRQRQEAAVTVAKVIEDGTTDTLKSLEMTVEEMPSKERDATFSEAIRVTRDKERGAPQEPDKNPLDFSLARRVKRPMF